MKTFYDLSRGLSTNTWFRPRLRAGGGGGVMSHPETINLFRYFVSFLNLKLSYVLHSQLLALTLLFATLNFLQQIFKKFGAVQYFSTLFT